MCDCASDCVSKAAPPKPPLIGEIFRRYGRQYVRRHPVTREQWLAVEHIARCRTEAMGANLRSCSHCGHSELHYNSCGDRHCPRCQWLVRAGWIVRRQARALPVPNFLVTFTVPEALRAIAQSNPEAVFALMFQAASRTLIELGAERLGTLGFTIVLHTWSRQLIFHPHLHAVVAAGGLAGDCWTSTRPDFLFPVARVRALFRKQMLQGLHRLYDEGALDLTGELASLSDPVVFGAVVRKLWETEWIVDIQPPQGKPEHAVKYLAAYTRSVAISEHRMVSLSDDGVVTFKTRGPKRVTLAAAAFIRRFLLHVLPSGLHKTRHYGLYANGSRARLEQARQILAASQPCFATEPPEPDAATALAAATTWQDRVTLLTGNDPRVCPRCGRDGMILATLALRPPLRGHAPEDTS